MRSLAITICSAALLFTSTTHATTAQQPATSPPPTSAATTIHGPLSTFTSYALDHSPTLSATAASWRASRRQIDAAGRLPNPVISYGLFLRRVETRVGSQRQRFGITQAIPWPTVLSADVDAARSTARSRRSSHESARIEVRRRTENAFWDVWALSETIKVQRAHEPIVKQLLQVVEAHLEVGSSTLADHGRVAIALTELGDRIDTMDQKLVRNKAILAAVVGADITTRVRVAPTAPPVLAVVESLPTLQRRAMDHPRFKALDWAANVKAQRARQANAARYPSIALGVDYIDTAATNMDVVDNGKDPILVRLSVQVPLWQGSYRAAAAQKRAEQASVMAHIAELRQATTSALIDNTSRVEDTVRRIRLYKKTLIPQAESVFSSTIAAYQTGRATISDVLLAWGDLLQIQSDLLQIRANHAKAWANLRAVVGGPVRSRVLTTLAATS